MEIPDECKDFVIDLSAEREINDLLFVTDIVITDYSSVCFEYSLLNKPMIFFAYDLEDYRSNLRGFYFDFLEEAPGPVVLTNDDLIDSIKNYNPSEWEQKYKAFNAKYNHCDDGKASSKIVDLIKSLS